MAVSAERISSYEYNSFDQGEPANRVAEFYALADGSIEARVKILGEEASVLSVIPASKIELRQEMQISNTQKIVHTKFCDLKSEEQQQHARQIRQNLFDSTRPLAVFPHSELSGSKGVEKVISLTLRDFSQ